MVVHIFNSSVVSGPETLAIPALARLGEPVSIIFLTETRMEEARNQGPIRYAQSFGHATHEVRVRGRWDPEAFRKLRGLLDQIDPKVVHAHDVKASTYLLKAARSGRPLGAMLVSTHHGAAARKGLIRLYEEFYVRMILPRFDAVLCVCESDRKSLIRRGLSPQKVHVHLNGVDRPKIPLDQRERIQSEIREHWKQACPALRDLRRSERMVLLGAVSRLSSEKRHDRMLRVLAWIRANRPDLPVVLLCFGTGAEEARLRELARELDLESAVFWMGYSKTISQEMAGFDLLLSLSDGEGIPISLIEAGWAATPVFSTRVGGIPDLIPNEEFGALFDKRLDDAQIGGKLAEWIEDQAGLQRVGAAFQQRIERSFSEASWLQQLRGFYEGGRQTVATPLNSRYGEQNAPHPSVQVQRL